MSVGVVDRKAGVEDRKPIAVDAIRLIQFECMTLDDELRWLVVLVSDTGLRLAEAVGLHLSDIDLDHAFPLLVIKEHPWRRLKTEGSNRLARHSFPEVFMLAHCPVEVRAVVNLQLLHQIREKHGGVRVLRDICP